MAQIAHGTFGNATAETRNPKPETRPYFLPTVNVYGKFSNGTSSAVIVQR